METIWEIELVSRCGNLANIIDIEIRDQLNWWHLTNWKLCKINNCPPTVVAGWMSCTTCENTNKEWRHKRRVCRDDTHSHNCRYSVQTPLSLQGSRHCRINAERVQNEGPHQPFIIPNRDLSSWALCQAQLLRGPSFSDEHIIRTHCWYTICVFTSLSICFQHVSYLKLTHINISLNLPQGVERLVKVHYRS